MFPKIEVGRYYPSDSIIHKLSPLTKLLCLFFLLIDIFIANPFGIMLLIIYISIVCHFSNVPYSYYSKTLLVGFYFFAVYTMINILMGITYQTILIMAFRYFSTILVSSILLFTTKPMDLNRALEQFLSPLRKWKIKTIYFTFCITLTLHFIPLVSETTGKLLKALSSAGYSLFHSSWKEKILYLKSFFVPLFILSFKQADQFAEVLEVRQFSLEDERTYYHVFSWKWYDNLVISFNVLFFIFLILRR